MTDIAKITRPNDKGSPLIVSVPHCGTYFPAELRSHFLDSITQRPVDTDWFVDRLYDFVPDLGGTLISAVHSRYVIDLNRSANQENLYQDQRRQTALCPTYTFDGDPLYKKGYQVDQTEIDRRLKSYYWPYYTLLQEEIARCQKQFGYAILYDAHSIARLVPSIRPTEFPDMILGDNEGRTCHPAMITAAKKTLDDSGFSWKYNDPFKGGQITRHWGRPGDKIFGLQMEMSQDIYMDTDKKLFDAIKAKKVQNTLMQIFRNILAVKP